MSIFLLLLTSFTLTVTQAKEIALTFDDAPMSDSGHFTSAQRTDELIAKLKKSKVPGAMIFANPCKRPETKSVLNQLKKYRSAGHQIGNHTCSHPRLDEVGYEAFAKDAAQADVQLSNLMTGQKFFRFPYLNEGTKGDLQVQMRQWMAANKYRNGLVSVDTNDYIFSFKINQAKERGLKVNHKKVEALFLKHILGAVEHYDDLAVKTLGYSPKHVLLLHEMDATVMYLEPLIQELRQRGWKIISAAEAYQDKLYLQQPKNKNAGDGIIAQLAMEDLADDQEWGKIRKSNLERFEALKMDLDKTLGLKFN